MPVEIVIAKNLSKIVVRWKHITRKKDLRHCTVKKCFAIFHLFYFFLVKTTLVIFEYLFHHKQMLGLFSVKHMLYSLRYILFLSSGATAQWYSQRTFVLEVAGSIPAPVSWPYLVVTVTRPNSLTGRGFVITGCLTVDPLETTDRLSKSMRSVGYPQ